MTLKAVVSQVKELGKGDSVSYGRIYRAPEDNIRAATVTVGYADGYSRLLSEKAGGTGKREAMSCYRQNMHGSACAGTVSHAGNVREGDIVTLIGRDGNEEITADELASLYGTIGYEVVCGISKRVPRIYVD